MFETEKGELLSMPSKDKNKKIRKLMIGEEKLGLIQKEAITQMFEEPRSPAVVIPIDFKKS